MGRQIIILACLGTFNPELIRTKLAPVLAEAGLQIEGASTHYDGRHHLAIGRPEDITAALAILGVSRGLAPEKKEGGPPSSASAIKPAKAAKAGKKEGGPPLADQQPGETGPVGEVGEAGGIGPVGTPGPDGGGDEPAPADDSPQTEPLPPSPPPCSE